MTYSIELNVVVHEIMNQMYRPEYLLRFLDDYEKSDGTPITSANLEEWLFYDVASFYDLTPEEVFHPQYLRKLRQRFPTLESEALEAPYLAGIFPL